ncbi:tbc1 domain family member 12-like [Stylonychia lemnae]|uniref:Tbc1 domain family member 12-like n=1 Tax=Stylonychia lemnae TaxID=5949 RepID=A0A078APH2_STYLE|nr:tbc1 domain family member 12-like [Stylonychia lemnae]|eukprot:CDW84270.1 tbc1 domain family member 12-like [Stylonychia lemnae]
MFQLPSEQNTQTNYKVFSINSKLKEDHKYEENEDTYITGINLVGQKQNLIANNQSGFVSNNTASKINKETQVPARQTYGPHELAEMLLSNQANENQRQSQLVFSQTQNNNSSQLQLKQHFNYSTFIQGRNPQFSLLKENKVRAVETEGEDDFVREEEEKIPCQINNSEQTKSKPKQKDKENNSQYSKFDKETTIRNNKNQFQSTIQVKLPSEKEILHKIEQNKQTVLMTDVQADEYLNESSIRKKCDQFDRAKSEIKGSKTFKENPSTPLIFEQKKTKEISQLAAIKVMDFGQIEQNILQKKLELLAKVSQKNQEDMLGQKYNKLNLMKSPKDTKQTVLFHMDFKEINLDKVDSSSEGKDKAEENDEVVEMEFEKEQDSVNIEIFSDKTNLNLNNGSKQLLKFSESPKKRESRNKRSFIQSQISFVTMSQFDHQKMNQFNSAKKSDFFDQQVNNQVLTRDDRLERNRNIEQVIVMINNDKFKDSIIFMKKKRLIIEKCIDLGDNINEQLDEYQAKCLGKFLFETKGLNKNKIGEFIGKRGDPYQQVNKYFFQRFSFYNEQIDCSLRKIFQKMRLPLESQNINNIIEKFSAHYWNENSERYLQKNINWSEVNIYTLASALIALNSCNHNRKAPKKFRISKKSFLDFAGQSLPSQLTSKFFSDLYDSIMKNKFESKIDISEKFFRRVKEFQAVDDHNKKEKMFKEDGTLFIKYGRLGHPHSRKVYISQDESEIFWRAAGEPSDKNRYLKTDQIIDVRIGANHSKVFLDHQKSIPQDFDHFCMSIFCKKVKKGDRKSLDLRIDSQEIIQEWYHKIKSIIENNRIMNQQDKHDLNEVSKRQGKKEIIEGLWSSEILINLHKYIDPLSKQLIVMNQINLEDENKQMKQITEQIESIYKNKLKKLKTEKQVQNITNNLKTSIYYIWLQGLPKFSRVKVWPILFNQRQYITKQQYQFMKQQFVYQRLSMPQEFYQKHQLSSYLLKSNEKNKNQQNERAIELIDNYNDQLIQRQVVMDTIDRKVYSFIKKNKSQIEKYEIDEEYFKECMLVILGVFSIYRPDIGFIKGLDRILAQLLYINLPYYRLDQDHEVFDIDQIQFQIFDLFCDLLLNNDHMRFFYALNEDEISWRLSYFETSLKQEIPTLYDHFQIINLESYFYIYDWLMNLFTNILPKEICWRIWDIYFIKKEPYLYKVAIGILKFVQDQIEEVIIVQISQYLIQKSLNETLHFFKNLIYKEDFNEEELFEIIEKVKISEDLFYEMKATQQIALQKASIYQYYQ